MITAKGLVFFVLSGLLIGFGTRYAGGCTSGHSIMGLNNLQWPSLIATHCFMIGGFTMTHLLMPNIMAWLQSQNRNLFSDPCLAIIMNIEKNTSAQVVACDAPNEQKYGESLAGLVKYLIVGVLFGIVFVKAELISWFRVQEMFRLQSFHIYGIMG